VWIAATFATATAHAQTREVVTYYHADAIGSIRMITDANGQVIERHDYLPFGEEWQPPPSSERRLYGGKERDPETAFDYFGARYYASAAGRFTTVDPSHIDGGIFDPQRWNAYAYARGNPLRFIDPFGFDSCPAVTDTSSCVEGGAPTADFVTNFAWYLFAKSLGIVASLDNPPPGVTSSSPFSLVSGATLRLESTVARTATQLELPFASELRRVSGLVIGRGRALDKAGAFAEGEYRLGWFSVRRPLGMEAEWSVNEALLRDVMKLDLPIRDISPLADKGGFFLNRERTLLRTAGWSYQDGYWYPPLR